MLRKRKKQANTRRQAVWKPKRLLRKFYLVLYCDSAQSHSHLLEKEVNGWVKNLSHPASLIWHFSPLLDLIMSCTPFHHTLEYVVVVVVILA